jgi:hypothetical protein
MTCNLEEHARIERLLREHCACYSLSIGIEMKAGDLSQQNLKRMREIEADLGVTHEDIHEYFRRL